jgi:hypothetical protein
VVGLPHTFRLIPVYPSCAEKNIIDLFHFLLDCTMQRCIQFMLQFIIPQRIKNAVWTLVFLEVEVDNHGGPTRTSTCHIEVAVHTSMYWSTEVAVSFSFCVELRWQGGRSLYFHVAWRSKFILPVAVYTFHVAWRLHFHLNVTSRMRYVLTFRGGWILFIIPCFLEVSVCTSMLHM